MPIRDARTLSHNDRTLPQEIRTHFDAPLAYCGVTAGGEALNTRRLTLQVRDRTEKPWARSFVVAVWLATASGGAPSATGNTVTVITGTQLQEVTANAHYVLLTDANGVAAIDVEITGGATRYVATTVSGGLVDYSPAITWT